MRFRNLRRLVDDVGRLVVVTDKVFKGTRSGRVIGVSAFLGLATGYLVRFTDGEEMSCRFWDFTFDFSKN